jgi:hypothetical protein
MSLKLLSQKLNLNCYSTLIIVQIEKLLFVRTRVFFEWYVAGEKVKLDEKLIFCPCINDDDEVFWPCHQ